MRPQNLGAVYGYVRWKSIQLCIWINVHLYILQVRAYFIVSWNSSSVFSKKETKLNQFNFYTRQSLLTHLSRIRWLRDKIYEALKHRVERRMYFDWLWINCKLTVGLRYQPFEVDASSVWNTAIPWQNIWALNQYYVLRIVNKLNYSLTVDCGGNILRFNVSCMGIL